MDGLFCRTDRLTRRGRPAGRLVSLADRFQGIYIIYTSGTTGLPKGVVRDAGGHAVGLHLSISYVFGIHGPGDVVGFPSSLPRPWQQDLVTSKKADGPPPRWHALAT